MPIEVRRFGVGHRRPEGPPGTRGLSGQIIHSDGRGVVTELAFTRGGSIAPHDNRNTTWFCVIEGGGWVAVGEERIRVAAGDAVLWPAHVTHAAWTDHAEMRAIVVEFVGADDGAARAIVDGALHRLTPGEVGRVGRGEGRLADPPPNPPANDARLGRSEGEPR